MNTKNLVALALLVGIGAVLHAVIPPIFLGMKPDMMLLMMFLGIILFPEFKNVLLLALVTGIISALTTGFPGGQIPNIIDKLVTAFVFFGLFAALKHFRNSIISAAVLTALGT
ncbi:tryptophan transporter, partial [Bacillus xiapuensis]|nr:tryptophan transporter [Bacillus xiapuensis]